MRIATYNLRNLFGPGVRDEYGSPFEVTEEFVTEYSKALLAEIVPLDADILVVEEVGSEAALRSIAKSMGEEYRVFLANPDERGICVAVIHRITLEVASLRDVGGLPSLRKGEANPFGESLPPYRDILYAKADFDGKPVHVLGMHLKANGNLPERDESGARVPPFTQRDFGDGLIRTAYYKFSQARRVRELIDAILSEDSEANIVVLGDMNDVAESPMMRIITGLKDDDATRLVNATLVFSQEDKISHYYKGKGSLIDHILVSRALLPRVARVEIRNTGLVDQTDMREEEILASDHAPVVMELE